MLNNVHVDKTLISMFYRATVLSVLTFCITAWGGNTNGYFYNKFDRVLRKVSKITKKNQDHFMDLLILSCSKKLHSILKDQSHPLYTCLTFSPRSGRLLHLKATRERYKNSFLPFAVRNNNIHTSRDFKPSLMS